MTKCCLSSYAVPCVLFCNYLWTLLHASLLATVEIWKPSEQSAWGRHRERPWPSSTCEQGLPGPCPWSMLLTLFSALITVRKVHVVLGAWQQQLLLCLFGLTWREQWRQSEEAKLTLCDSKSWNLRMKDRIRLKFPNSLLCFTVTGYYVLC